MPNWVYQSVTITGSEQDLANLREQVSKPYINKYTDKEYNKETQAWDIITLKEEEEKSPFSFWNIVKPADEILDVYYGLVDDKPKIADLTIRDKVLLELETSNGWYAWNCRNWGTKWGACDVDFKQPDETTLIYTYNTAWSPSIPALLSLSSQYPAVTIEICYEEEQGWGGEMTIVNGETIGEREYDIPKSHADFVERDQECHFCLLEDPAEDCPPV